MDGHSGEHGHSHDHTDAEAALASSAEGIRAVKVSLAALGLTALAQLAVAMASGSVALLADTVHNAADAMTAVPLWIAFRVGRRPATRRYSYGYQRAEDLAGVFVVLVIAASALVTGWQALDRLMRPTALEHLGWVLGAGIVGALGNEVVAVYRIRVGRRIGSAALVADGQHARADGLTSLGVVLGATGVALGFERADPAVGLAITVAILLVLRSATRSVLHRMMDGTDESIVVALEAVASKVAGVEHVTSARARWTGHDLNADLEIQVDPHLTVERGHDIAEAVEHELLHALPRLRGATVHVDPHDHGPDLGPVAHHRRETDRTTPSP